MMASNSDNYNKCSVVVSSYDGNDDIWGVFFVLFFRYWPDCPFQIYLISNYKKFGDDRVKTICVGKDRGWAANMKTAIRQIPTPYLICMLDDLFLEKITDTDYVMSLVNHAKKNTIAYIGLTPFSDQDDSYTDELNLKKVKSHANRVSFRASLWDKKIFDDLIIEGENFWQMEEGLSKRSYNINALFLSVTEPALHYQGRSGIIRGKWMYDAVRLCKKEGIKIDLNRRPIDYEWKWKQVFDAFRKNPFIKKLAHLPVIGKILSWFFWRVFSLKINKISDNS